MDTPLKIVTFKLNDPPKMVHRSTHCVEAQEKELK